jgi:hypothetical protein
MSTKVWRIIIGSLNQITPLPEDIYCSLLQYYNWKKLISQLGEAWAAGLKSLVDLQ